MQATSAQLGGGRFRLRRRLGEGGMGVVYEAFDELRRARVALKQMHRVEPATLYRFKREFRALADVVHPNLVALHELFSDEGGTFLTMELVEGTDLLGYVRAPSEPDAAIGLDDTVNVDSRDARAFLGNLSSGPPSSSGPASARRTGFDERRLRAAFRQLAEGVAALHVAGQLHRDLKPTNVMVTRDDRVVVLDFGLVASARPELQTMDPGVTGTPAYMSPEQATSGQVGESSDWYAFGVMLFEALTGALPYDGPMMKILIDKQQRDAPAPASLARGVPPDLDALCVALLRRDPLVRPAAAEILALLGAALPARTRAPSGDFRPIEKTTLAPIFVGRERQLSALREAYRASRQGRTVVQLVFGETGLGKTHLVQRFVDELEALGALVLRGRCYEHESVPFKALDSAMDALSAVLRKLPRADVDALLPIGVHALTRVFPVLQRVEAIAKAPKRGAEAPDPQELRRRAARALRSLLDRMSVRRPLVLWVDDLQWGDEDSAALLAELVRPPDAPPLLLVGSFRSEEMKAPFISALAVAFESHRPALDVRELEVEPLGRTESRELATLLLGPESASPPIVKMIAKEAEGSPFLIEQLVRHTTLVSDLEVSLTRKLRLDDVLRERIDALDADARALLEVVAIAGRPIARPVAAEAARLEGAREMSALAALRVGRWVRSHRVGAVNELDFYHHRLRAAVVARVSKGRDAAIHGAIALALLAAGDDDPERLLLHFLGAGERARAGGYAELAADGANEALAFARAATHYRTAIELLELEGDDARPLRRKLAEALVKAGHAHDAALVFLEAARGASEAEALELRRRAAQHLLRSGHIQDGIATLDRVLAAIDMKLVLATWVVLLMLMVELLRLRLRGYRWRARDASQLTPAEVTRLEVCWSVGAMLAIVQPAAARVYQVRTLRLALASGDERWIALGLVLNTLAAAYGGTRTQSRTLALAARAEALIEQRSDLMLVAWGQAMRGSSAYLAGRFAEALVETEASLATFREQTTGTQWEQASILLFHAWALFYLGAIAEMSRRIPAYIQEAREHGDRYLLTNHRIGLPNVIWLAAGAVERAESELGDAMRDWGSPDQQIQQYYELVSRVHIDLYRGHGVAALGRVEARWASMKGAFLFELQLVAIEAWHLRARAALAAFDETADPKYLAIAERAARRIEREGAGWAMGLADLVEALVLAGRGDREGAQRRLRDAVAKLEAHKMKLFVAAANRRLGELLGGAEGEAAITEASAVARSEGIMDPGRFFQVLAPGLSRMSRFSSRPPAPEA